MRWRGSVALAAIVLAAACSKTNLGSSTASPDFAQSMAQSFCGALQSCCAAAKYTYDPASCLTQIEWQYQMMFDATKRANVVFDAKAAAACQKALNDREAQCNGDSGPPPGPDQGFVDALTRACFGVVKGTLAPGAVCDDASQCELDDPTQSAGCVRDGDPTSPTFEQTYCARFDAHARPGDACDLGGPRPDHVELSFCEQTLGYCVPMSADGQTGTCQPYQSIGQPCGQLPSMSYQPQCGSDSYCDHSQGPNGVCQPFLPLGAPCKPGFTACVRGAYCDGTTCVEAREDGQPCASPEQCKSGSCAQHPIPDSGQSIGKCFSWPSGWTQFTISPRSCGFGPNGSGPDDAGIRGD
jgi:hypothetical protein